MRSTRQMSITLPLEMARLVKEKVDSGNYSSESEVIRDGLRALLERDQAVERWLREDVAPAYDAHMAAPALAKPLPEVKRRLRAFMNAAGRKAR